MAPEAQPTIGSHSGGHVQAAVLEALLAAEAEIPSPDGLVSRTPLVSESKANSEGVGGQGSPVDDLEKPLSRPIKSFVEWTLVIIGAAIVSLLIRNYLFQAFYIESGSMLTTLVPDDRVLVNRLSYEWGDVGRGDVVVFSRLPEDRAQTRDLIKRVIGLPGDIVEGRSNAIYINGTLLDEPYLVEGNDQFGDFGPIAVPEGELFVLGDNRDESLDSRRFGTVNIDRAAGRAFVIFWPLDRVGSL